MAFAMETLYLKDMKKIVIAALVAIVGLMPMSAQSRKVVKRAKEEAKLEMEYLKDQGYSALDKIKLEDEVRSFLVEKYSQKSCAEVVGKATGYSDLNEAKAQARNEAVATYPVEDVSNIFFVYRKSHRKYDVLCYALVHGASYGYALNNPNQHAHRIDGMDASIATVRAAHAEKEAKQAEKKAKAKAKAAEKKAKAKAKAKAKKDAQKAADKAYKEEMKKSGYKR